MMKNTFTNQLNQKYAGCILTYNGKEVVLTDKEEKSLELLFGETVSKLIDFFKRLASSFKRIGKGLSNMKEYRKEKHIQSKDKWENYINDYKNMKNLL
ncbi:MAG TPA: hypothetical protein PK113_00215 [Bacillota bacterium]|nr:hypothetical protein [Bacillota bacterium]